MLDVNDIMIWGWHQLGTTHPIRMHVDVMFHQQKNAFPFHVFKKENIGTSSITAHFFNLMMSASKCGIIQIKPHYMDGTQEYSITKISLSVLSVKIRRNKNWTIEAYSRGTLQIPVNRHLVRAEPSTSNWTIVKMMAFYVGYS